MPVLDTRPWRSHSEGSRPTGSAVCMCRPIGTPGGTAPEATANGNSPHTWVVVACQTVPPSTVAARPPSATGQPQPRGTGRRRYTAPGSAGSTGDAAAGRAPAPPGLDTPDRGGPAASGRTPRRLPGAARPRERGPPPRRWPGERRGSSPPPVGELDGVDPEPERGGEPGGLGSPQAAQSELGLPGPLLDVGGCGAEQGVVGGVGGDGGGDVEGERADPGAQNRV